MKILMLSIFAPHFFNWTEQLKNSGMEVYWLDILDSNTKVKQIDFAEQIIGWRYKWDYPGRYFLKKNAPRLTEIINIFNERDYHAELERQIKRIKPDVVQSYVMYLAGVPALPVMKKYPAIKWIYTAWGSDMYYYQNQSKHLTGMRKTLPQMDYMFSDCKRDYIIAKSHGFKGEFLGAFPGGGGFKLSKFQSFIKDFDNRKTIIIKGYQGLHGRCIPVLNAIGELEEELKNYEIIVFGANKLVFEFLQNSHLKNWKNFKCLGTIPYTEVMELMGSSLLYMGNSLSDGIPNTLLEAIIMEAFPIQSNPGDASAELIDDGKNGYLIRDPENHEEIRSLLIKVLSDKEGLRKGIEFNNLQIRPKLERSGITQQVIEKYRKIEMDINFDKFNEDY